MRPSILPITIAIVTLSGGCDSYPYDRDWVDEPLWEPAGLVTAGSSVYGALPRGGDAFWVSPGGGPVRIELGDRRVRDVVVSPDGATVLARTSAVRCDTYDDLEVKWVADCPLDDLVEEATVEVIAPADRVASFPIGPWYDRFVFSDDGRFAVALQDPAADTRSGGVVNLTSVLVLDLDAGERWEVSVGFRASRVLFTGDQEAGTAGMVVLSQSEVAVVDLSQAVPVPDTVFPLTLDADIALEPVGIALTPDDAYALITVADASDLYVLDLVDPSINIVSLAGRPSAMAVDEARDRTVVAYGNQSVIEVLDHALFEVTTLEVDEVTTDIFMGPDFALFWSTSGRKDVYRLDLETLAIDEYRLQWAPYALQVAPDASFAVALSSEGESGRLEVLDLRQVDGRVDDGPKPFGLAGPGLDVAFVEGDGEVTALLLQQGVDRLYQLAWPSLAVDEVDLPSPPVALDSLADGSFWISHVDPLGLISFYTPGGDVTSVGGFGRFGLYDRPRLLTEEEE